MDQAFCLILFRCVMNLLRWIFSFLTAAPLFIQHQKLHCRRAELAAIWTYDLIGNLNFISKIDLLLDIIAMVRAT